MVVRLATHGMGQQLVAIANSEKWHVGLDGLFYPAGGFFAPGCFVADHRRRTGNDDASAVAGGRRGWRLHGIQYGKFKIARQAAEEPGVEITKLIPYLRVGRARFQDNDLWFSHACYLRQVRYC